MVVCGIHLRLTNTALRGQRIPPQPRIYVAFLNNPTKLHAFQAAVRQAAADRLRTPLPPQLTGAQAREVTLAVAANPVSVIWWARCLISKNVASYILADAQNLP